MVHFQKSARSHALKLDRIWKRIDVVGNVKLFLPKAKKKIEINFS